MKIDISDREFHTVLAALRFAQEGHDCRDLAAMPHFDGGIDPLNDIEIDALCERINAGEPATVPPTDLLTAVKSMQGWAKNFSELLSIHHPGSISEKPHGPFNQDMEKASVAISQAEATVPPAYSVLLLYPITGDEPETYFARVDAESAEAAVDIAKEEAAMANDEYIAADFDVLAVFKGRVEMVAGPCNDLDTTKA